ncbi:MAG: bifunctional diaminohydroxyphosphoribosylaminopyrimidine deaminase/5-amino-6-(5-phosphoribosylamino)uracil reductase RibD [Planktomarina sp.]
MTTALALGRRGQGRCWPNPAVGCVLVKEDRVIGRGFTQPGGRPHAEVVALAQAGNAAKGATAYVTLEPCAHVGKTGPCSQALVKAGIARCVIATTDPDPRVSGKGIGILKSAGIDVTLGVMKPQADMDHRGFFMRISQGRPRLTLKLALSLDGRIATASGESQWITGPAARRQVHGDRMIHDAVLVGGGTARADNPTLTVRGLGAAQNPVRIIAARKLDFEGQALADSLDQAPLWLLHGADAPQNLRQTWHTRGANLIEVPTHGRMLDPSAMLQALGAAGLTSVYCEGGGAMAASLLQAGLVDDVLIYHAGIIIGAEGRPGLGALEKHLLGDCPRFELVETRTLDGDIRSHWRRKA